MSIKLDAQSRILSLTTGEVAQYCDVTLRTVIRWIERGDLKAFKLPGRGNNRIQVNDFLGFLRKHEMPIPRQLMQGPKRILVVDDEVLMAEAIQRVLKRAGYSVEIALNGFWAGEMLASFQPNVLTLDLCMPGINGFEVLNVLRGQARYQNVKCLVISALPSSELDKALALGADDCLAKPFNNEELLHKLSVLAKD